MSNQLSEIAQSWPLPAAAYRDPGWHSAYTKQVQALSALDANVNQIAAALTAQGIKLTNTSAGPPGTNTQTTQQGGSGGFSGILGTNQGGTGLGTIGTASQVLGVNTAASGLEYITLEGTSGEIGASYSSGRIQFGLAAAGTAGTYGSGTSVPQFTTDAYGRVTAVAPTAISAIGFSAPGQFTISASASPGGSVALAWQNQSANLVLAGPGSGSSAAPTFRALVAADLPAFFNGIGAPGQGAVLYVDSSGSLTSLAAGAASQALLSGGAGANPSWGNIVNSVAGGTGVTASASTGSVTLSIGQAVAASSSPTFSALTLSGMSMAGVVHNSSAGLLSSSAVSLTTDVSGTLPVANGGTGLTSTSQNYVFAGPTSGSGAPSWRALAAGDIPSLSYVSSSATQSANALLSGPSSGSAAAPTFRTMVLADLPATYANIGGSLAQGSVAYVGSSGELTVLTPGTSGQFLKTQGASANPVWASNVGSAGGSSSQVQFNSSGTLSADAGFVYGGQGGSTLLGLTPTSTSATALLFTQPASFTGNIFEVTDPSSNVNAQLTMGANFTPTLNLLSSYSATGPSTSPVIRIGQSGYSGVQNALGGMICGLMTASNVFAATSRIVFAAGENQSSGHLGTEIWLYVTPNGSTASQPQFAVTANGNVVCNLTGSALSTSGANGFLYIPSCAGVPTGTPTSYTGCVPLVFDSTHNKLYAYTGGAWAGITV